MQIPTYIKQEDQENYNEDLNQTINDNLSDNGFIIPQISNADLLAISPSMPDGTFWYCTDHVPPVYVGKISGALVKFTTAAYP